ncbi:MAG: hypothetical protein AB7S68_37800, partial [Polyangiaceae bacterium]
APSAAPQTSSLSVGNADEKIPAAFSDRQPKSEPVSSPVFEAPPPSLQAVVRPSEPAAESSGKAWMLIALVVLVIVGVAAYFMTRPGPTP